MEYLNYSEKFFHWILLSSDCRVGNEGDDGVISGRRVVLTDWSAKFVAGAVLWRLILSTKWSWQSNLLASFFIFFYFALHLPQPFKLHRFQIEYKDGWFFLSSWRFTRCVSTAVALFFVVVAVVVVAVSLCEKPITFLPLYGVEEKDHDQEEEEEVFC